MITLKDFMETVDYKITEGSDYGWQCYGRHAYRLDSWNQDHDGHSVSIVFDTRTHVIYEASVYDYQRNRAYRLINSDFKFGHDDEAQSRGVVADQAWDDVKYIDLETDEDFLTKAQAIVANEDYDTRISVPLTLPDDEMLILMKMAHERDVTFNQLCADIIEQGIAEMTAELADMGADQFKAKYRGKLKKSKKVPRRDLAMELRGVIADVEQGEGFDDVCLTTIKRVAGQLARR
jgi:hypothetical protein